MILLPPDRFHMLGVINVTPNSFSDGGECLELSGLAKRAQHLLGLGVHGLDFGAESTAPMNSPISHEEELRRLEGSLLLWLRERGPLPSNTLLSLDSYRPATIGALLPEISRLSPGTRVLWNDVSGQWDKAGQELMDAFPQLELIFCHNLAPTREDCGSHMQHVLSAAPEQTVYAVAEHFLRAKKCFAEDGILQRIWWDPCFGFSKTYEQNLQLLKDLATLVARVDGQGKWVLGISRKSFLRKSVLAWAGGEEGMQAERLHAGIVFHWMRTLRQGDFWIRLHDPKVFWSAGTLANLL